MSILKIYPGASLQALLAEIVSPVEVVYLAVDQPEPDTLAALSDLMALTPHALHFCVLHLPQLSVKMALI